MKLKKSTIPLPFYKISTDLTVEAQDFLSQTTDGTSHYAILNQLIKDTAVFPVTTSKRGNVIQLKKGQVECSINSFSQMMSLGRKAMERIIHDFERLGIIRLHRSRLATIADMLCISDWQLNDDTVIYNSIQFDQSDPHAEEQTIQMNESKTEVIVNAADAHSEVESKSPADTFPSTSQKSSVPTSNNNSAGTTPYGEEGISVSETSCTPSEDKPSTDVLKEVQGASSGYIMDLFGNQSELDNDEKSSKDVP